MKIKKGFMLQNVAGNNIVVPTGEKTVDFNGIITLNDSGMLLWKKLETGTEREELADVLINEYEGLTNETALADVDLFIKKLEANGLVE